MLASGTSSGCFRIWLLRIALLIATLGGCSCVTCTPDSSANTKEFLTSYGSGACDMTFANMDLYTAVPTYALNWDQHQGTTADLAATNSHGTYGENDLVATWAGPSTAGTTYIVDLWASANLGRIFDSNSCLPGRKCGDYVQVGYVFNSMTL